MCKRVKIMLQVTWSDVDDWIDQVTIRYAGKHLSGVYGIPRGGTVLAIMLSHAMDIPCLSAPCKNCLIVDDISDTGITLKHYHEKGYQIATMYSTDNTEVIPDFSMFMKKDDWIVFPWERTRNDS